MHTMKIGTALFFGGALVATSAAAQDYPGPQADPVEPSEPVPGSNPMDPMDPDDDDGSDADVRAIEYEREESGGSISRYGVSLTAGGGVAGFTDETMRSTAAVGGTWDVRAAFGTHYPIAIEAGYLGSAQSLSALGLDEDAVLLGTAFEGVARVNLLPRESINPYFFGGAAWRRYDVTNTDTNTSDVTESDNLLEIPVGIGIGYRFSGFIADLRGEFRIADQEDLIRRDLGADRALMHTWSAGAKLGYEF